MDVLLYRLSIPFALVTGGAAGVLAALAWWCRRYSPFGAALELLAVVMASATVYHAGLLVVGSATPVLRSLLVGGSAVVLFALVAAAVDSEGGTANAPAAGRRGVFLVTAVGVTVYAVGGPLSEVLFPPALHWVHGFAALVTVGGLVGPVRADLRGEPPTELLPGGGQDGRRLEWTMPIDEAILELLSASGLVLTPAVVAFNIGYSREEVNRRLAKLVDDGLVERVERGKYRVTDRGVRYVEGEPLDPARTRR